jgi:hypothetical protein
LSEVIDLGPMTSDHGTRHSVWRPEIWRGWLMAWRSSISPRD